ncbi:MAG: hypothetical protein WCY89_05515 [Flavobacteriaceae bacterium]
MKKNLLLGIIACGMLFTSCSQDEDEGTTGLNVPDGGVGFTKDGQNIVLSNCYYSRWMNGESSIETEDPQIVDLNWRVRNDTEDTYQFTTGSMNGIVARFNYYYLEGEEVDPSVSWKMTSGAMTIKEKTSEPVTISGTFEGTLTKFEGGTATSTTFEVTGKFVKLPRTN